MKIFSVVDGIIVIHIHCLFFLTLSVPPDLQIEDADRSLASLMMEILGSSQKTEFDVGTWVSSLWVKMRTASLEDPLVPFSHQVIHFNINAWLTSHSIDEHLFFSPNIIAVLLRYGHTQIIHQS